MNILGCFRGKGDPAWGFFPCAAIRSVLQNVTRVAPLVKGSSSFCLPDQQQRYIGFPIILFALAPRLCCLNCGVARADPPIASTRRIIGQADDAGSFSVFRRSGKCTLPGPSIFAKTLFSNFCQALFRRKAICLKLWTYYLGKPGCRYGIGRRRRKMF